MSGSILVRNGRVLSAGGGWLEGAAVALEDGRIAGVGSEAASAPGDPVVDAEGLWVVPGWIDLQVNDIGWLSGGLKEPRVHASRIREVLTYQASTGVTGLILATLAAPLDEVLAYLEGMKEILDGSGELDEVLLGGLVEGTFMNPEFHGAHNPDWVLPPDPGVLDQLLSDGSSRPSDAVTSLIEERCSSSRRLPPHQSILPSKRWSDWSSRCRSRVDRRRRAGDPI